MMLQDRDYANEIAALKKEKNAVVLAHNYQLPEVQDVADFIGDSLALSRHAAHTNAEIIIFCGVHFMAETASIICPEKRVFIPDLDAGCSLSSTINAEELKSWIKEHPDAIVVSYVNTIAEVTKRKNMYIWPGECHVHAGIKAEDINKMLTTFKDAEFLIHPECSCTS